MSQEGDCVLFLSRLIETGRYQDFDIACETMEIFIDYDECLHILERVEDSLKEQVGIYLDPVFKKMNFYRCMIS